MLWRRSGTSRQRRDDRRPGADAWPACSQPWARHPAGPAGRAASDRAFATALPLCGPDYRRFVKAWMASRRGRIDIALLGSKSSPGRERAVRSRTISNGRDRGDGRGRARSWPKHKRNVPSLSGAAGGRVVDMPRDRMLQGDTRAFPYGVGGAVCGRVRRAIVVGGQRARAANGSHDGRPPRHFEPGSCKVAAGYLPRPAPISRVADRCVVNIFSRWVGPADQRVSQRW
jgi:hypothetical protein